METRHSTRVSARTRPQRTSWGVWALVGVLGFGSADAGGAGPGAYAVGVDAIACAGTFLMSLHPGLGKPGGRRTDLVLGVAALAGVVLWRGGPLSTSGAAVVAVSCEAVALWPTLREGWRRPGLESLPSWAPDVVGNGPCLTAIGTVSVASLAYPLYVLGAAAAMTGLLLVRRVKGTQQPRGTRQLPAMSLRLGSPASPRTEIADERADNSDREIRLPLRRGKQGPQGSPRRQGRQPR